jgi:23S rRNA pseudouridine1911/1915/1917 synthase
MTVSTSTYTVTVAPDKAGSRLDRLLAEALPEISRTRLKALIEDGRVEASGVGAVVDPARRVHAGETFVVAVPTPPPATPRPQAIPLAIVYEDAHLVVVDKPAGLVVHAGAGNPDGTLVNALLAHCPEGLSSIGAPLRPGIVHRLDKDTSGLVVVAKTDAAHLALARQFAEHSVERAYRALVWGNPRPAVGRVTGTIGRSRHDRTRMAVVSRGGKVAVTQYRTLQAYGSIASLVECRPATGRTHQIRVHMASIGNPIIGDPVYGGRRAGRAAEADRIFPLTGFPRQALHAFLIGFRHSETGDALRFLSPLPNDYRKLSDFLEEM